MGKAVVRLLLTATLAATGTVVGIQTAAWADAPWWCRASADRPLFDGSTIIGRYWVTCISPAEPRKLYGRIKEDRIYMPDVVHKTGHIWFRDDMDAWLSKNTCQDSDHIYIEGQMEDGPAGQSRRREMHC